MRLHLLVLRRERPLLHRPLDSVLHLNISKASECLARIKAYEHELGEYLHRRLSKVEGVTINES